MLYKEDGLLQVNQKLAKQLNVKSVPIYKEIEIRVRINPLTRVRELIDESNL